MKRILIHIVLLLITCQCWGQERQLRGRVLSALDSLPLSGASIKVKGDPIGVSTDRDGRFSIGVTSPGAVLLISYIGYTSREVPVDSSPELTILLVPSANTLSEVVISTGYESVPQERATGSFVTAGAELLNRRVSTDIVSRLEDVVPGLVFNRVGTLPGNQTQISIRGQSTINAKTDPLIVVDNFPYEGDINSINPNDVESITVLKDAAAASIWGARAGNGVIVITTKAGKFNTPLRVSFNSNVSVGARPDLFYESQMGTADFIEVEKALFAKNFYRSTENSSSRAALSPVVELLIAKRDGKIAAADADAQIEALKRFDVRRDLEQYVYRESVNQQYSLNLNGGAASSRYYISGGLDRNLESLDANSNTRVTFNAANTFSLVKSRLQLTTGIYYTQNNREVRNTGLSQLGNSAWGGVYPYARLKDDQGNPASILKTYRSSFIENVPTQGLLSWQFSPLQEMQEINNTSRQTDYRINTKAKYNLLPALSVELLYQYGRTNENGNYHRSVDSYYARNEINRFTRANPDGSLSYGVPVGGILDVDNRTISSHNIRGQFNFSKHFNNLHQIDALAGSELRAQKLKGYSYRLYGYNEENATFLPVDYMGSYPLFYSTTGASSTIPNSDDVAETTDRFLSWYANAAYTYNRRYTLSLSGRLDQSNLFGVNTNQKGVPLYSAGVAWNVSEEDFYNSRMLPYLKLRFTYGYNGNIDKSLSAYTTARYWSSTLNLSGLPFSSIINPPNPELRWERVRIINAGIDFRTAGDRFRGSVEYYKKDGSDLIATMPFPASSGITAFTGNTAETKGDGLDIALNTTILKSALKWNADLFFSYAQTRVTNFNDPADAFQYAESAARILDGKPVYAVYSYPWAGLDPQTGDPQGYLNGEVSKSYSAIRSGATMENIIFHGSARPLYFGGFRNTVSWKNLSLSANISYRLGYYFKRNSIVYGNNMGLTDRHGDYARRWQKAGDEAFTYVPSVPLTTSSARDNFFNNSSVLVEKADHIRLQDISLSYDLSRLRFPALKLRGAALYLYGNNLGILWKATETQLDPDYETMKPVRTLSAGLRVDL